MAAALSLPPRRLHSGLAREQDEDEVRVGGFDVRDEEHHDLRHTLRHATRRHTTHQSYDSNNKNNTNNGTNKNNNNNGTSALESLPAEIITQILTHLVHPRSRLPGLTETQSAHDFPRPTKLSIKNREDLTTPPDAHRWAADIFAFNALRHPLHVLALTSRRLHAVVEMYCAHLVRACNRFNLPFAHLDTNGPGSVFPDLSGIVYRRLWLQHAPRRCVYCHVALDCYPFRVVKRLIASCGDCFYRQTLTTDEVQRQYHIPPSTILSSPHIRSAAPDSPWVLRIDVEAMALQLYGTRAFHAAHADQLGKPCSICAITRFPPAFAAAVRSERGLKRGTSRPVRSAGQGRRKGVRRSPRLA